MTCHLRVAVKHRLNDSVELVPAVILLELNEQLVNASLTLGELVPVDMVQLVESLIHILFLQGHAFHDELMVVHTLLLLG